MKDFIRHCFNDHPDEILQKSIQDCHVIGMHSIMFESSGRKVRMFYTQENHELWKNLPQEYRTGLSLGFHPHHCNISLTPVQGSITNWIVDEDSHGEITTDKYQFTSHINSGNGGFKLLQRNVQLETKEILQLGVGDSLFMPAKQMHSVGVLPGQEAAWFVFEGQEDENQNEHCYSNKDLSNWSAKGLYNPFADINEIREKIMSLGLL